MDWYYTLAMATAALLLLMAIGVPIAFAFGLVAFTGLALLISPDIAFQSLAMSVTSTPLNWLLLSLPLFIFMGEIILASGLVAQVFESLSRFFGGFRGSLALSTFAAATGFAAVSGSSLASTATIGLAALPEMKARGYSGRFSTGVIAASGGLAIIIPPSVLLIIYGFIAQVSVRDLFLGGVIPGLLMVTGYGLLSMIWVRRNPSIAPPGPSLPWEDRLNALLKIWPMPALAILMLASIYLGIASITEAAAMGAFGAVLIALCYGRLSFKTVVNAGLATAQTTGFLLFLMVGAIFFGYFLAYTGVTPAMSQFMAEMQLSPLLALIAVNLLLLLLGCIMDTPSITLVVLPIILPGFQAMGMDLIWLGIIFAVNLEMGLSTPPVGMVLYVMEGVGRKFGITFDEIMKGALLFLLVDASVIILMITFPQLVLWLPSVIR